MKNLINAKLVRSLFPESSRFVRYAFVGNHINRYRRLDKAVSQISHCSGSRLDDLIACIMQKNVPSFDLIMAVDQVKDFHKINLKDSNIKKHYTYFARFTHGRAVKLAQRYGAKIHFNEIKMPIDDLSKALEIDSSSINQEELNIKDGLVVSSVNITAVIAFIFSFFFVTIFILRV